MVRHRGNGGVGGNAASWAAAWRQHSGCGSLAAGRWQLHGMGGRSGGSLVAGGMGGSLAAAWQLWQLGSREVAAPRRGRLWRQQLGSGAAAWAAVWAAVQLCGRQLGGSTAAAAAWRWRGGSSVV